jgi:hypothetical protein
MPTRLPGAPPTMVRLPAWLTHRQRVKGALEIPADRNWLPSGQARTLDPAARGVSRPRFPTGASALGLAPERTWEAVMAYGHAELNLIGVLADNLFSQGADKRGLTSPVPGLANACACPHSASSGPRRCETRRCYPWSEVELLPRGHGP